jgi:hypothetical protein
VNNFCTSSDADYDRLNAELNNENKEEASEDTPPNREATKSASERSFDPADGDDETRTSKGGETTTKSLSKGLSQTKTTNATSKKTVTFKAGLTDERNHVAYRGALINRDQVIFLEKVTSVLVYPR